MPCTFAGDPTTASRSDIDVPYHVEFHFLIDFAAVTRSTGNSTSWLIMKLAFYKNYLSGASFQLVHNGRFV